MQIYIGGESGLVPLDECSVVTAPYEVDGEVLGTVGVIGPTRMAYERVIPIVEITARLLSSAMSQRVAGDWNERTQTRRAGTRLTDDAVPAAPRAPSSTPGAVLCDALTLPEPSLSRTARSPKIGILLVNLGTPEAPTAARCGRI